MFNILQKKISFMEGLNDNIDLGMLLHSKNFLPHTGKKIYGSTVCILIVNVKQFVDHCVCTF